jgi:hypothetical protein
MPGWGDILAEVQATRNPAGGLDFDSVRRKYLTQLARLTGRSTVVYASDWLTGTNPAAIVTCKTCRA